MGVNLKDILIRKEITFDELKNKIIIIDSYNMLYQFLTTIRAPDGNVLTDSQGNVTSHLIGLFSRTTNFMQKGLKPVFVFDGKVPELKHLELAKRKESKIEAQKRYEEAKAKENIEEMKKYAARTSRLTQEMVESAKELIHYLGLPIIQAPSEGEAQASFIVKQGDGWAVASQDYDSLLHGATRLVQNLSVAGKRKIRGKLGVQIINPTILELKQNLENLGITNNQLIAIAMLVGTDYNPGGIKGIGPKNALKLVKQYGENFEKLFEEVKWKEFFNTNWDEVYNTFKEIPTTKDYEIKFKNIDDKKISEFLIEKHDFGVERVEKTIKPLLEMQESKKQKGLMEF